MEKIMKKLILILAIIMPQPAIAQKSASATMTVEAYIVNFEPAEMCEGGSTIAFCGDFWLVYDRVIETGEVETITNSATGKQYTIYPDGYVETVW